MKVTIEEHRGLLRLPFNDGKRRCLALGVAESTQGRSLAAEKKIQIERDWQFGYYDPTLLKYKPRTLGKSATEISVPELFDRFTQHQAKMKGLSQSSIDTRYIALRKMLEKVLNAPANTIGKREAERFADVCTDTLQASTAKARIWLLVSRWDFQQGLTFSPTGIYSRTFRLGCNAIFGNKGSTIFIDKIDPKVMLGVLTTRPSKYLLKSYASHTVETVEEVIKKLIVPH